MPKKQRTSFVCQECGYDSQQWLGKCPECGAWNSLKEFSPAEFPQSNNQANLILKSTKPLKLKDIVYHGQQRVKTEYEELNTVLGGGFVVGSVVLLAGDPGVGKSTLLLQVCISLAEQGKTVLYISGEESIEQIKLRAERLGFDFSENLYLISLSDPDAAILQIIQTKPDLVIVDSIQTMQSEQVAGLSGSVGQVRYAALHYIRTAKAFQIPIILVGHVTKEGMVAGPMVLSHMVDTVLFLEGEKFTSTRILRSFKNRFGPLDEVGIFLMEEKGLKEVTHPEQVFLTSKTKNVPGSVIVVTMEGSRAFLVEIQALAVYSKLPMPRRIVSGLDQRRVELLLAVLQKHCRLPVETMDVFVNVAGGLRLSDPAADIGVCLAVYSSIKNIPLPETVGIGEVGLLGEIRSVFGIDKRIKEAKKLGFKRFITPKEHRTIAEALVELGKQ
jgi:DNA repair protein RadA/Sms